MSERAPPARQDRTTGTSHPRIDGRSAAERSRETATAGLPRAAPQRHVLQHRCKMGASAEWLEGVSSREKCNNRPVFESRVVAGCLPDHVRNQQLGGSSKTAGSRIPSEFAHLALGCDEPDAWGHSWVTLVALVATVSPLKTRNGSSSWPYGGGIGTRADPYDRRRHRSHRRSSLHGSLTSRARHRSARVAPPTRRPSPRGATSAPLASH